MQRHAMSQRELDKLEPKDRPFALAVGIPGVRVHVAVSGTKTFQLRVGRSTRTLGKVGELSLAKVRQLAASVDDLPAKPEPPKVLTIEEWLERYVSYPRLREVKSMGNRVPPLRHLLRPILKQPPSALTTEWLNQRLKELMRDGGVKRQGGLKLRSIVTYRKYVVALVNFMVAKRGLERSPFLDDRLETIQVDPDLKSLRPDEVLLLEQACSNESDYALACFTLIGLHTGLRRSEILKLQRDQIDLDSDPPSILVLAENAKSGHARMVGVSGPLKSFLKNRLQRLPERSPFWFPGVDERFAKLVKRAGIHRRVTPHMLRHTAAYILLSHRPIHVVQSWLGHRSMLTTQQYTKAHQNDVLEAASVFKRPVLALG